MLCMLYFMRSFWVFIYKFSVTFLTFLISDFVQSFEGQFIEFYNFICLIWKLFFGITCLLNFVLLLQQICDRDHSLIINRCRRNINLCFITILIIFIIVNRVLLILAFSQNSTFHLNLKI